MIVIKKKMKLGSWSVPGGATKNKEYLGIRSQISEALMPNPSTGKPGIMFGVPDPVISIHLHTLIDLNVLS